MANERDFLLTQNGNKIQQLLNEVQPPVQNAMPVGGMLPNRQYNLGLISEDTAFVLANPTDNTVSNYYYWCFEVGNTVPNISWPLQIRGWSGKEQLRIEANMYYEIMVINGFASHLDFSLEEEE